MIVLYIQNQENLPNSASMNTVKGQIFMVVLISLCSRSTIFPQN